MVESAYAVTLLTRDAIVKPGESVELECYLAGFGEPRYNKLEFHVSVGGFLDENNLGYIEVSGKQEEELFRFGDQHKQRVDIVHSRATIGLARSFFKTKDEYEGRTGRTPEWIIPQVMTEIVVGSTPRFCSI